MAERKDNVFTVIGFGMRLFFGFVLVMGLIFTSGEWYTLITKGTGSMTDTLFVIPLVRYAFTVANQILLIGLVGWIGGRILYQHGTKKLS